jgi:hypothetical protein
MHWRDGVHCGWRQVCRELFTRMLLSIPLADTYPHSDTQPATHTHTVSTPHAYTVSTAYTDSHSDARVSQRHRMYWRDGVHCGWRQVCRELPAWLLLSVPLPYAHTHSDAGVSAWHHMYWSYGMPNWRRDMRR